MSDANGYATLFAHYEQLQKFVGWKASDSANIAAAAEVLRPHFSEFVADFYEAIEREPATEALITGGLAQKNQLRASFRQWLEELFGGVYDAKYVEARWRVGRRHVEIGLRETYANAAISRLRSQLLNKLELHWSDSTERLSSVCLSLNRLLDLELAIMEDAYTSGRLNEQRRTVRRQSEASFRKLVEGAQCIIIILRSDQSIAYINPFAEHVTGYSADETRDQDFLSLLLPQSERSSMAAMLGGVLSNGESDASHELPISIKDGERRSVLWRLQKLDEYRGGPAVLAVGQDITELKNAQERLLQSERLAAIGETVTGLAHESRNAFQRSQACLELLQLELADRPNELELVERVQRSLNHLHRLYEEVRNYASPMLLNRQMCNLAHIWRDAWSQLEVARADKAILLREVIYGVDLNCQVDWFQTGQVFRNILENAIVAISEKGVVTITCSDCSIHGVPGVRISIHDSGAGIDPATRAKVFLPFFTTKSKGTGLGMAIARRIVESHNGQLTLGSPDVGAEFLITLPRA